MTHVPLLSHPVVIFGHVHLESVKKHLAKGGSLRLSFYLENEKKIPGTEVLKMTVIGFEPPIF